MKLKIFFASLLLVLILPNSAYAVLQQVIQVPEKVFIPHGFDNNDQSEIVLYGHFPNTCFHAGPANATVMGEKVIIKNTAYVETAAPCLEMIVPWTTTVTVGVLKAGAYAVLVQSPTDANISFGELPVAVALSQSIDDHLYAYATGVQVKLDEKRIPLVTVMGSFSLSCMYIKGITTVRETTDVVDVLPIVGIDKTKPCANLFVPVPFQKSVKLKQALTEKNTLFHVRTMNGQSLNFVRD